MRKPLRILLFVVKNTAVLDFSLPLLWKIRQKYPETEVSVLYCALSKQKFLRKSTFYSEELNNYEVKELDFVDYLSAPLVWLKDLWRVVCGKSRFDTSSWALRLNKLPFGQRIGQLIDASIQHLESYLLGRVDFEKILPRLNPAILLMDNTILKQFPGYDEFNHYFSKNKKKIVLLPHAPHHSSTTAFTPFQLEGDPLPPYCEYWMPFRYDQTWKALPKKKSQFVFVGYPGFDKEWLDYLKHRSLKMDSKTKRLNKEGEALKCLFIVRRFLPPGKKRAPKRDDYAYDFDEFFSLLKTVRGALENTDTPIKLVVKPHPSNNFHTLAEVLSQSKIPLWKITHEPMYALTSEIDMVISLYSTVLLIPAMMDLPVILLHSTSQSLAHKDKNIEKIYSALTYYLKDPEDLSSIMANVIDTINRKKTIPSVTFKNDYKHLRSFFPDNAIARSLDRLKPT